MSLNTSIPYVQPSPESCNADDRTIQIIPRQMHSFPPNTANCIVKPLVEQSDSMTWHDRGSGSQEQRSPPAFSYHSGTLLTVLSVLRCRKYFPQAHGHSIYVGRSYNIIRDFHDLGSVQADAVHYHRFPVGKIKVIQQLMVTKTNVCPHIN
eukprot:690214-Amphidinium_carterae.2